MKDLSNALGCVPADWTVFYQWLATRRAVTATVSEGLSILENFNTSIVCDLVPLKGTKEQLLRAVRRESDSVLRDELARFMKLSEKRK